MLSHLLEAWWIALIWKDADNHTRRGEYVEMREND